MPESVGQHREHAVLVRETAEDDDIAADSFVKMSALAAAGVDEEFVCGFAHFPKFSMTSFSSRVRLSA